MIKHVHVREQVICETTFYIEALVDQTRSAYFAIDCPKCLRQALAASEARSHVLRELLAKAENIQSSQRCRIADTLCINPAYCEARDACCAGDPNCLPDREKAP